MAQRFRIRTIFTAIAVLFAGSLVASSPAQAAITSAHVTIMTMGSTGTTLSTFSTESGTTFSRQDYGVMWETAGGGFSWLRVWPPRNTSSLTPGIYRNASWFGKYPRRDREPMLDYMRSHLHVGCEASSWFIVNELTFAPDGSYDKVDIQFFCETWNQSHYGQVLVNIEPPQSPAAGAPYVAFAGSSVPDHTAVNVYAGAPAGVAAITTTIHSLGTGEQVASTSSFTRYLGTDKLSYWTSEPISAPLPPGFYRIDASVTDMNGVTTVQTGAGRLAFLQRSTVLNPGFEHPYLDYDQRSTQVGGTLVSQAHGTLASTPMAGATVYASVGQQDIGSAVTAADGSFSIPVAVTKTTDITLSYAGDPANNVASMETSPLRLEVRQTATKLTGPEIFWGPDMVLTGVATYQVGDEWLPLVNTQIEIQNFDASNYGWATSQTTTDAEGRYAVSHYSQGLTRGKVRLTIKPVDPFVASAQHELPLARYYPEAIFDGLFGFWDGDLAHLFGGFIVPGNTTSFTVMLQQQTSTGWRNVGFYDGIYLAQESPPVWVVIATIEPPCGTSRWRMIHGGLTSTVISANKPCVVPRRQPGTRVPQPPRRG